MRGAMSPTRKRNRSSSLLLLLLSTAGALLVSIYWGSGWSGIGAHAFQSAPKPTRPFHSRATTATRRQTPIVQSLSSNNNDNDNNDNDQSNPFGIDLIVRRFENADKIEIRNDATLVACYVLCRFLVYDITSGAKVQPGWEIQDWIWLTGTFSSATVLVIYYVIAALLSRTYEANTAFAAYGPSPVVRALVNVVLCCPVWLATEHLLGFGPPDIGGGTLAVAVATGFVGFGSFMALAKALTAGMR